MIANVTRLLALLPVVAMLACGHPTAPPSAQKLELVAAPAEGDVAAIVKAALGEAQRANRQLLVYVGAKWCEPCRRFHDAAKAGRLDQAFPRLRVLEFDMDRDGERLAASGYTSEYIPLFARPATDGRASGRQIAGSVKGEKAIGDLEGKLQTLLVD